MISYAEPIRTSTAPLRQSREIHFTQRQTMARRALFEPAVSEVLYGGARGGGKSVLGCCWLYAACRLLIDELQLPVQQYPIPIAWMGRQRAVDAASTLLVSWQRIIPPDLYELRPGDRQIIIGNRLRIDYGGLDDQNSLQKFNGAEYAWIWVDQAEECSLDAVAALRGTLRRTIGTHTPQYKALWTANPAPCWLKDEFVDRREPGRVFVPALPTDNPNLPDGYLQRLRAAYRHRPELLAAMLEGRWDVFASTATVIKGQWVIDAVGRHIVAGTSRRRVLAVDVARFGDDETVLYGLEGTTPIRRSVHGHKDTMFTANRAAVEARQHNAEVIAIDATGLGAGVADRLTELGFDVLAVETGGGSTDPTRFVNLRAELWDHAARLFESQDVAWTANDEELARELCWPQYEYKAGGRLQIESKQDLKDRMGKSPDYADAYVLGLAATAWLGKSAFTGAGNVLGYRQGAKVQGQPSLTKSSYAARRAAWEREQQAQAVERWT